MTTQADKALALARAVYPKYAEDRRLNDGKVHTRQCVKPAQGAVPGPWRMGCSEYT